MTLLFVRWIQKSLVASPIATLGCMPIRPRLLASHWLVSS